MLLEQRANCQVRNTSRHFVSFSRKICQDCCDAFPVTLNAGYLSPAARRLLVRLLFGLFVMQPIIGTPGLNQWFEFLCYLVAICIKPLQHSWYPPCYRRAWSQYRPIRSVWRFSGVTDHRGWQCRLCLLPLLICSELNSPLNFDIPSILLNSIQYEGSLFSGEFDGGQTLRWDVFTRAGWYDHALVRHSLREYLKFCRAGYMFPLGELSSMVLEDMGWSPPCKFWSHHYCSKCERTSSYDSLY